MQEIRRIDRTARYARLIKRLLCESSYFVHGRTEEAETVSIQDDENHHYLLLKAGWSGQTRIHSVVLHLRIHEEKIWIEEGWTEEGIAEDLLREGVPREDIVLGFQHPKMRSYTDFAVA